MQQTNINKKSVTDRLLINPSSLDPSIPPTSLYSTHLTLSSISLASGPYRSSPPSRKVKAAPAIAIILVESPLPFESLLQLPAPRPPVPYSTALHLLVLYCTCPVLSCPVLVLVLSGAAIRKPVSLIVTSSVQILDFLSELSSPSPSSRLPVVPASQLLLSSA